MNDSFDRLSTKLRTNLLTSQGYKRLIIFDK